MKCTKGNNNKDSLFWIKDILIFSLSLTLSTGLRKHLVAPTVAVGNNVTG